MSLNRKTILGAAVASIAVCCATIWFVPRAFDGGVAHAHASGEHLSFSRFRSNELIVVSSAHGDRGIRLREYRFYWAGGEQHVDMLGNTDALDYSMVPLLAGRKLSESELEGLDRVVSWFRRVRERPSFAGTQEYKLTYYRDNQEIGSEVFIGFELTERLGQFARSGMRAQREFDPDYNRVAAESNLARVEIDAMFPFEYFELDVIKRGPSL